LLPISAEETTVTSQVKTEHIARNLRFQEYMGIQYPGANIIWLPSTLLYAQCNDVVNTHTYHPVCLSVLEGILVVCDDMLLQPRI